MRGSVALSLAGSRHVALVGQKVPNNGSPAWITGCLVPVALVLPLVLGPMQMDPEMRAWPLLAKVGLISIVPVFILVDSALVGFIYADAKRRRMRHVIWAWLALVP